MAINDQIDALIILLFNLIENNYIHIEDLDKTKNYFLNNCITEIIDTIVLVIISKTLINENYLSEINYYPRKIYNYNFWNYLGTINKSNFISSYPKKKCNYSLCKRKTTFKCSICSFALCHFHRHGFSDYKPKINLCAVCLLKQYYLFTSR